MNPDNVNSFDALDAYLTARQRRRAVTVPPPPQAALIDALVNLVDRTQPDPVFARALGLRLQHGRSGATHQTGRSHPVPMLAYALLAVIALAILGTGALLLLRPTTPQPVALLPQVTATTEAPARPAATPVYTLFPTPEVPPTLPWLASVMGAGTGGGGGTGGSVSSYSLSVDLPAGPAEAPAFFHQVNPPVTPDSALQIAKQWKLNAALFMTPGVAELPADSPDRYYFALDGMKQLILDGNQAHYQDLAVFPVYAGHQYPQSGLPPADQAQAIANAFLAERGLLDPGSSIGLDQYAYGIVTYSRVLDGIRLQNQEAWVQIDPQGRVGAAFLQTLDLQPVGSYPLLSAQEAWQLLSSGNAGERTRIRISPLQDGNPMYWGRIYPAGQVAQLYGALQTLLVPVTGGAPRLMLNNLVLEGDTASLAQANQAGQSTFHVWGIVQENNGVRSLQVAGWEPFDEFSGYFKGTVQRQPDGAYLVLEDGRRLQLPDLPADVPDGEPLYVNGGQAGDVLEWFILQVHPASEGQVPGDTPSLPAVIDQVELIYIQIPENASPQADQDPASRMLIPAWQFSGLLGNDQRIVILVQANR